MGHPGAREDERQDDLRQEEVTTNARPPGAAFAFMRVRRFATWSGIAALAAFVPAAARAHEAYVLSADDFHAGMASTDLSALHALAKPENLRTFILLSLVVTAVLALNLVVRESRLGRKFHGWLEKFEPYGLVIMRVSIGMSLILGGLTWNFLGPEISLRDLPVPGLLRFAVLAGGALILSGFITEVAAAAVLMVFTVAFFRYGMYLATYLNYLGELLALILFGARLHSIDGRVFGPRKSRPSEKWERVLVRVSYGLGLMYAAVSIKLLHPDVTLLVVDHYDLTRFKHMFPSDPQLLVFGAALAEFAIGAFILFGFETRLTVLVSLYYITLSLAFFRELVWPHLLLYGVSLYLLVAPEDFTVDDLIDKHWPWRKKKPKPVAAAARKD